MLFLSHIFKLWHNFSPEMISMFIFSVVIQAVMFGGPIWALPVVSSFTPCHVRPLKLTETQSGSKSRYTIPVCRTHFYPPMKSTRILQKRAPRDTAQKHVLWDSPRGTRVGFEAQKMCFRPLWKKVVLAHNILVISSKWDANRRRSTYLASWLYRE